MSTRTVLIAKHFDFWGIMSMEKAMRYGIVLGMLLQHFILVNFNIDQIKQTPIWNWKLGITEV